MGKVQIADVCKVTTTKVKKNYEVIHVATLTLGSRPKQGLVRCRPRMKLENHISCSQEYKRV
jgi:hypothetical protein